LDDIRNAEVVSGHDLVEFVLGLESVGDDHGVWEESNVVDYAASRQQPVANSKMTDVTYFELILTRSILGFFFLLFAF